MSDYNYCVWLSQGQVAFVDREDHWRVTRHKWSAAAINRNYYAVRSVNGKPQYLHQFIMDAQPGEEIDHEDGDGLNCRRLNLRSATRSQNLQNRKKFIRTLARKPHQSAYKGVDCPHGEWRARVRMDGKLQFCGYFDTELEAARAYDAAAKRLHADFCRLNFPEVA